MYIFFFENNNNFMEFTFALEPNKVNTQRSKSLSRE